MLVFRMREYAKNGPANENCAKHKIEAVSEIMAQRAASFEPGRIYFFADLTAPEDL